MLRRRGMLRLLTATGLTLLLLAQLRLWIWQALPSVRPEATTWAVSSEGEGLLAVRSRLLVAPVDGRPERVVAEGTRVAKGQGVVRLLTDQDVTDWHKERAAVADTLGDLEQRELPDAQAERRASAMAYVEAVQALRQSLTTGDGVRAAQVAAAGQAYARWQQAQAAVAAAAARQQGLEARLEHLNTLIQRGAPLLTAPEPGTVSYRIDGLETVLTPENLLEITPAAFARWLDAARHGEQVAAATEAVRAGTAVAEIIDSWSAWIALPVPTAAIANEWVKVGSEALWTLAGVPVRVRIVRIDPAAAGPPLVVAQLLTGLPELLGRRVVPYRITWGEVQGYVLPATAIAAEPAGPRVALVEAGRMRWQPVRVLERRSQQVLVEGLEGNERVLVHAAWARWLTWPRRSPVEAGG